MMSRFAYVTIKSMREICVKLCPELLDVSWHSPLESNAQVSHSISDVCCVFKSPSSDGLALLCLLQEMLITVKYMSIL